MMLLRALFLALMPLVALCAVHNVQVGVNGLNYSPMELHAAKGDKVVFHFHPGDHGVARGSYTKPCHPYPNGFWSGFFPKTPGTFTITITDTDPRWVYCPQVGHCEAGMSMVINPSKGQTVGSYQSRSKNAHSIKPKKIKGGKRHVG